MMIDSLISSYYFLSICKIKKIKNPSSYLNFTSWHYSSPYFQQFRIIQKETWRRNCLLNINLIKKHINIFHK